MKSGMLILNIIVLILVGILFYWHFSAKDHLVTTSAPYLKPDAFAKDKPNQFRIAYFDMDSVSNSFSMVKEVKNELSKEEDRMNGTLNQLQKEYSDHIAALQKQAQANQMTQVQSEQANREVMQMQDRIRNQKQSMDQSYQDMYMRKMQDIKSKIEDFLKDYNKDRRYAYIFGYEPGFIYYRDSVYNITGDLVKGLNEKYGKKK